MTMLDEAKADIAKEKAVSFDGLSDKEYHVHGVKHAVVPEDAAPSAHESDLYHGYG